MLNTRQLLKNACERLTSAGVEDAEFDASQLLAHACGVSASRLILADEIGEQGASVFTALIERRSSGEPLQYIIGEWDFYKYPFFCGEGVLIPRPETEELAVMCIDFVRKNHCKRVIDLCSGTGCIGISIALECPQTEVTLVDYYDGALSYLERNVRRHSPANVKIIRDDVLSPAEKYPFFGLIVSNPPYIPTAETATLQREVTAEPLTALDGGRDGLDFYRAISRLWLPHLAEGGMLAVECAENQTAPVAEMFSPLKTDCLKDIYGNPRFVTALK